MQRETCSFSQDSSHVGDSCFGNYLYNYFESTDVNMSEIFWLTVGLEDVWVHLFICGIKSFSSLPCTDICLKHKCKAGVWRERCWQEPAAISDALARPWTLVPCCGCCKHSCCSFSCCQHPGTAGGGTVGNTELCFSGSCVEKLPENCA